MVEPDAPVKPDTAQPLPDAPVEPDTAQPLSEPEASSSSAPADEPLSYPAHRAAYVDDAAALRRLTAGWAPEDWASSLDDCGNTVCHVAALRGAAACLRLAYAAGFPETRNAAGWTPFQEAVSAGDERTARLIFDLQEVANPVLPKGHLKEEGLRALRSMPDFTMKIKWRFGSPLLGLLVARYAPSDTYTVWKRGERLRIDGTLLGVDVGERAIPSWRRGKFSLLVPTPAAGAPPRLYLINHTARRYATSASFKKAVTKEGGFHGAPKPRASVTLTARPQHASAVAAGAAAVTTDCAITVEPPTAADGRFHDRFMRGVFTRDEMKGEGATFRPAQNWRGQPLRERVDGVPTAVFEASTKIRSVQTHKTNRYELRGGYDEYAAEDAREAARASLVVSELLELPVTTGDALKAAGLSKKSDDPEAQGSRLRARVWLAPQASGFPLTLEHLLLVLRVLAVANTGAARMAATLEKFKGLEQFPMRVQVPLLMTLYAQVLCSKCEPCAAADAPDAHFELPEGYDEGDMLSILTDAVGELGLDDDTKGAGSGAGPQAPSPEALHGGEFSGL